ncbi:MAG: 16S rRNA (adenine(1518)-N(6)/adenine(1519)-N(6)) -dimethyltransferase RsmA [Gammaproteobacteria bacterium]|nr:MAG: 16S rRNA (adenine(1518)-N(6)/adenine(1519)-N(6)) -dimethyltransferase RsmA [Gammaproteobacteria bacterium]
MHKSRKRFGQHFLHDQQVIQKIIVAVHPDTTQHILEIGPGHGALTDMLISKAGKLDAVELDRDLANELMQRFHGVNHFHVHQGDILKFDLHKVQFNGRLRLIGNLPYNISTPLLFRMRDQIECIEDMHFMLQKEVAQRICAEPGNRSYGRLSVMMQYAFQVEILFHIPPASFNPPPKVDSSFLHFIPHSRPPVHIDNHDVFELTVSTAFSQRRKTLRNTLKQLISESGIRALGIDPGARPETLTLAQFALISNTLYAMGQHGKL